MTSSATSRRVHVLAIDEPFGECPIENEDERMLRRRCYDARHELMRGAAEALELIGK